ncbi:MAG: hypothetical protein JXA66_02605 [Oligoflexia bacterium]|nr:hypothetical protein [Oligoflexia bacterium]
MIKINLVCLALLINFSTLHAADKNILFQGKAYQTCKLQKSENNSAAISLEDYNVLQKRARRRGTSISINEVTALINQKQRIIDKYKNLVLTSYYCKCDFTADFAYFVEDTLYDTVKKLDSEGIEKKRLWKRGVLQDITYQSTTLRKLSEDFYDYFDNGFEINILGDPSKNAESESILQKACTAIAEEEYTVYRKNTEEFYSLSPDDLYQPSDPLYFDLTVLPTFELGHNPRLVYHEAIIVGLHSDVFREGQKPDPSIINRDLLRAVSDFDTKEVCENSGDHNENDCIGRLEVSYRPGWPAVATKYRELWDATLSYSVIWSAR